MKHSQILVPPMCARHYYHGEAAQHGEAAVAVNVRRRDDSLEVTGVPQHVSDILLEHRLLLVDDGHTFTLHDGAVYCDGTQVMNVGCDVIAMHRVGDGVVVVTSEGLRHLRYSGDCVVEVSEADAVPPISIVAADEEASQQSLDAINFASPYSQWASPLAVADVATVTSRYRAAWNAAMSSMTASGAYCVPLMVRYGVRLWDDNYLYLSPPVVLGLNTLNNASKVSACVVSDGSKYTGLEASSFTMTGYRIGIKVAAGVGVHWRNLVKAIDVFVTSRPAIANMTALDYRCSTTQGGVRVATLQFGWQQHSQAQVMAALEASNWHLVASTSSLDALEQGRFVAPNVVHVLSTDTDVINASFLDGAVLLREKADAIVAGASTVTPVASLVRNGRLYVASSDGKLACTAHANAMCTSQIAQVTGARIMAIAPVWRPLYSGGFGRYAVYMFTSEGIYAVAQSALGMLGEARLVDRTFIAPGSVPVDGDSDVYFVDRYHNLCRLTGSTVTRMMPIDANVVSMAWDDAHRELHILTSDGRLLAIDRDGYYSQRTVEASMLYNDGACALAVTAAGHILDLMREQEAEVEVEFLTHPVVLNPYRPMRPCHVTWNVISPRAELSLSVLGERGASCHGFLVGRLRVDGALNAPLPVLLLASPCRTARLEISGKAMTGTVISTSALMCVKP